MTTCYCTSNTINDKYIDVICQYETHPISIFMNINLNVKNRGEIQGKTIAIERFLVHNMIVLEF